MNRDASDEMPKPRLFRVVPVAASPQPQLRHKVCTNSEPEPHDGAQQECDSPERVTYRDGDVDLVALVCIEMTSGGIGQSPRQLGINQGSPRLVDCSDDFEHALHHTVELYNYLPLLLTSSQLRHMPTQHARPPVEAHGLRDPDLVIFGSGSAGKRCTSS